jgi:hypothetical protein
MRLRRLLLSLAVLALAGCIAATPYGPASGSRDYGYSETRLGDGRWRVQVSANTSTDRETVERHLLRRAAELTLENGGERFLILDREVTPVTFHAPVVAAWPRPSLLYDRHGVRDPFGRIRREDPSRWRREARLARMGLGGPSRMRYATAWMGAPVHAGERPVTRWRASADIVFATGREGDGSGSIKARDVLEDSAGGG